MRLPFLPRRGSRPASERAQAVTFGPTGGHPQRFPPPPPRPRELLDVVGVGATETAAGVVLTLLSVERYREAHVVLFRLMRARGRFEREFDTPHLDIAITPAGAEPYRVWPMGSSGGGMIDLEFRLSYGVAPPPPHGLAEVVVEVREVRWERYRDGTYAVKRVDPGPWRFVVRP